jgi:succinoglycan biosynthesis transport protein ExoP
MKSRVPYEAEQVVDAIVKAYMAIEYENTFRGDTDKLRILENQRNTIAQQIESYRTSINELAREYGSASLEGRQNMMLQRVTSLQNEMTRIEMSRISLEARLNLMSDPNSATSASSRSPQLRQQYINADITMQTLNQALARAEQDLIVAEETMMPANPELQRKRDVAKAMRESLKSREDDLSGRFDEIMQRQAFESNMEQAAAMKAEHTQMLEHEQRIREILSRENADVIDLGRKELMIQDLKSQAKTAADMYETIGRRIQEIEMEQKRPAQINVAYNAVSEPSRDGFRKAVGGVMFAGFAIGIVACLIRSRMDHSIYTPDDISRRIDIRIVGTTTNIRDALLCEVPKRISDDFQSIRANLNLFSTTGIPQIFIVTSACAKDGKTVFSINLATSLAESGKRVLLIDGDLRKPDLGRLFNLAPGYAVFHDAFRGRDALQCVSSTGIENLGLLAANLDNHIDAPDILAAPRVCKMLEYLASEYDHIIIDTPPVLAVPDALLWAKLAGAAIMTGFAGRTSDRDIKDTVDRLNEVGVKLLGIVLNNVHTTQNYYRYGYDYGGKGKKTREQYVPELLLPFRKPDNRPDQPTGQDGE